MCSFDPFETDGYRKISVVFSSLRLRAAPRKDKGEGEVKVLISTSLASKTDPLDYNQRRMNVVRTNFVGNFDVRKDKSPTICLWAMVLSLGSHMWTLDSHICSVDSGLGCQLHKTHNYPSHVLAKSCNPL